MGKEINLYNKYRPKSFAEVIGQDLVKNLLLQTFKKEKLLQTFIFYGSHGTGKTSLARIFAKAWNCDKFKELNDVCNECENCKLINNSQTTDIYEVDAASHSGVEHVRELINNSHYVALNLHKKIYLIDECHNLSSTAWNALLKTIEEPSSEHVIFIFLTTDIYKIPDTILSRCQKYSFSKLDDEQMKEIMNKVCVGENIKISPEAQFLISELSQGSARDCLSILDQVFLNIDKDSVEVTDIERIFSLANKEEVLNLLNCLIGRKVAEVLKIVETLIFTNKHLINYLSTFLSILCDIYVYEQSSDSSLLKRLSEEEVKNYAHKGINYLEWAEVVEKSLNRYEYSRNKTEWLKITLFKLIPNISLSDINSPKPPAKKQTFESPSIAPKETVVEAPKKIEPKPQISTEELRIEIPEEPEISENDEEIKVIDVSETSEDIASSITQNTETPQKPLTSEKKETPEEFVFSPEIEKRILYGLSPDKFDETLSVKNYEIFNNLVESDKLDEKFRELLKKATFLTFRKKRALLSTEKVIVVLFKSNKEMIEFNEFIETNKEVNEILSIAFFKEYKWVSITINHLKPWSEKSKNLDQASIAAMFQISDKETIRQEIKDILSF